MITLGQELREERERRSISLKDISDRTKIGTRILLALETDRWELMPQKFFIKGVIKAYAEALGADPGIFLAKYDNQLQETPTLSEKDRDAGPRRTRPSSGRGSVRIQRSAAPPCFENHACGFGRPTGRGRRLFPPDPARIFPFAKNARAGKGRSAGRHDPTGRSQAARGETRAR